MRSRLLGTTVVAIHSSALSKSFEKRAFCSFLELFSPEFEMRQCCHEAGRHRDSVSHPSGAFPKAIAALAGWALNGGVGTTLELSPPW